MGTSHSKRLIYFVGSLATLVGLVWFLNLQHQDELESPSGLHGRVISNRGEFLADVQIVVTVLSQDTAKSRHVAETTTGANGEYAIELPIEGDYESVDVAFFKRGFHPAKSIGIGFDGVVPTTVEHADTTGVSYVLESDIIHPHSVDEPIRAKGQARIAGHVINHKDEPLSNVAIRVATPATDMRDVHAGSGHTQFHATTGEDGRYELPVPVGAKTASVDAMKPGYASASGALQSGGDIRNCNLTPGGTCFASFVLRGPTLFVSGVVTEETGNPVVGASVVALDRTDNSYGYIAVNATNSNGEFEIFDYELYPMEWTDDETIADSWESGRGEVTITHVGYNECVIEDVYAIAEDGRAVIKVVLRK